MSWGPAICVTSRFLVMANRSNNTGFEVMAAGVDCRRQLPCRKTLSNPLHHPVRLAHYCNSYKHMVEPGSFWTLWTSVKALKYIYYKSSSSYQLNYLQALIVVWSFRRDFMHYVYWGIRNVPFVHGLFVMHAERNSDGYFEIYRSHVMYMYTEVHLNKQVLLCFAVTV